MATPSKTQRPAAQSPWSLHANALNLMAQRGETTAMKRAIDSGADINECDREPLYGLLPLRLDDIVTETCNQRSLAAPSCLFCSVTCRSALWTKSGHWNATCLERPNRKENLGKTTNN